MQTEKMVIFVGGSSYSGSTLLDLTLGNDDGAFSCGEISNYFYPTRPSHISPTCGCGDASCDTWQTIKNRSAKCPYPAIFDMFPRVNFVVDSSKNPLWIHQQQKQLSKMNIGYKSIVIWKHPFQAAHSFKKRGVEERWERNWVNYHRLYFSLIKDWCSVCYETFISDESALKQVCERLGIPYFPGKGRYWERRHCIIGGNHSARVHLHNVGSPEHERSCSIMKRSTGDDTNKHYRSIYANSIEDEDLQSSVHERMKKSSYLSTIVDTLRAHDVNVDARRSGSATNIELSRTSVIARKTTRFVKTAFAKAWYQ